jgi:hypothetical protein
MDRILRKCFSSSTDRTAPLQTSLTSTHQAQVCESTPHLEVLAEKLMLPPSESTGDKSTRSCHSCPTLRYYLRPVLPNQEQRVGVATPPSGTVSQLPASYLFPWLPSVVMRTDARSGRQACLCQGPLLMKMPPSNRQHPCTLSLHSAWCF